MAYAYIIYLQPMQTKCNIHPNNIQTTDYTFISQQVPITETCYMKATGTNAHKTFNIGLIIIISRQSDLQQGRPITYKHAIKQY